ncbi:hypothetical protein VOLCADRAFT_96068 [Volvox carteri f. nagariensis]|uniref:Cilia- and flagella-associated protein 36 n=1 Tax=Volvox carteri f. nagariensis TaxID=3068 RepID=D8U945_VOLCA|nr:uncharacterized protein VOLCADRAFT_96068 [Volvox carteri f. nagariensis]EFJ43687.1 hypothetical protein VOLCADRAFT_96068 [Volvox carteri f. nagariensis]|eukprot:XP_002955168.1 hypothetical protein VOLCADRAFT_96068 [Volvox carteri f. nagariensis]
MADATWLSEAVVEFLKGPLYINPLMSFIDEKCLIFTPEEENKLEYTTCHNEFKELVDKLLTDFLLELGVGPEEFYKTVSAAQETDQLTAFVVQTILTVDDFLMFKAMMVRRNIDLTAQVLEAVEQALMESQGKGEEGGEPGASLLSNLTSEEEEVLREPYAAPDSHFRIPKQAMEISSRLQAEWAEADRLEKAMRALQLEDEEAALPVAIAASLREHAKFDSELADIEQAIALSLALEEERRRLASQGSDGRAATATAAVPAKAAERAPLPPVKGAPAAGAPPQPAAPAAPAPAADAAAAAASPRPQKFVPAPIDAPTGSSAGRVRGRGAGYKSEASSGVDLEAVRKAAQQAAESQKKLIGKGDANDEASKWLQEAKKKLVAQKQADREQEIEAYKAAAGSKPKAGASGAVSADEAKRAALREALAQKMKQSILQQA